MPSRHQINRRDSLVSAASVCFTGTWGCATLLLWLGKKLLPMLCAKLFAKLFALLKDSRNSLGLQSSWEAVNQRRQQSSSIDRWKDGSRKWALKSHKTTTCLHTCVHIFDVYLMYLSRYIYFYVNTSSARTRRGGRCIRDIL
jgi:hypothetical protein